VDPDKPRSGQGRPTTRAAIPASAVAGRVPLPDQRVTAISADPVIMGAEHMSCRCGTQPLVFGDMHDFEPLRGIHTSL
jgi:hypothetical protein